MKAPNNAIASVFFDSKANMYSWARIFGAWSFIYLIYINERFLSITEYYVYTLKRDPPETLSMIFQSLLVWAGGGVVTAGGTYAMNKWASRKDPILTEESPLELGGLNEPGEETEDEPQ